MPKTPDQVKKGLACAGLHTCPDEKCPYYASCAPCELQVQDDALVLIQQLQEETAEKDERIQRLEAQNAELLENIMWMEAERDDFKRTVHQLEKGNDRMTDELCNSYNIQNEQLARIQQLEAENASLRSERDIAVKALISVSDKVEMVQGILDDDIFHRVEYDVYLQLRDLVDNEIMSWQYESENSDGTQEDNNAESS